MIDGGTVQKPDDYDFISNVKALAANGTLAELLRRLEDDETHRWKTAPDIATREQCWHILSAIQMLHAKIKSFTDDEKIRALRIRRI